jgi:hypothetical protein
MKTNTKIYNTSFLNDRDFCNWLVGFTDGEGCFGLNWQNDKYFVCEFSFTARADDIPIYEIMKQRLGIGHAQPKDRTGRTDSEGHYHKPTGAFQIRNVTHLLNIIVPLFDQYELKTKKANEYPLWKRAVNIHYQHKILRRKDPYDQYYRAMEEIRVKLSDMKEAKGFDWSISNEKYKMRR